MAVVIMNIDVQLLSISSQLDVRWLGEYMHILTYFMVYRKAHPQEKSTKQSLE